MTGRRCFTRPILRRTGQIVATGIIAMCLTTTNASAADCMDQVRKIAHDFKLEIDPPDAGTAITPEELRQSGGIIEPPSVGDLAVREPPVPDSAMPDSAMPTTPELPPIGEDDGGSGNFSTTDRLLLEGILISARAEAEQGDVDGCIEHLQKARQIIRDRSGKL